ncbi:MAG: branched-chain amino acid ABC transporter permease [Anaerosomatales bacterium]|nr:branched-chain amino acid ABC transporter permease [Anaerosomatales bacterium]MDT8434033.1 branched-chain amino acid ABC transporter permease [Anaerosomatales bacterium]
MRQGIQAPGWLAKRSTVWILLVPMVAVAGLLQLFASSLVVDIYTQFCVNLMIVLALQAFMGNSGILPFTHVGWMGIGAYASGILSMAPMVKSLGVPNMYPVLVAVQVPIPVAIVLGGVVAALVAALIGWPLMRLSNAVGVITLFATLIVMHVVMTQWDNVTNGPRTFFGLQKFTTLWIAVIGAAIVLYVVHWYRESSPGLRLRASRDDRYAAMAVGINVVQVRYIGFVFSALLAGMAGGLWAHLITSFSPKAFYILEMFVLLAMLVIGGQGSVSGAFLGTAIVTAARQFLLQVEAGINNSGALTLEVFGLTDIVMAIFMVVVLIWRPNGIVGGREFTWPLFRRRMKPAADGATGSQQT